MRRALALGALLVGLGLLVTGVLWAVRLGPSGSWTATVQVPAGTRAVVLPPSLVSVSGPDVSVTAERADGGRVILSSALPADAAAYAARRGGLVVTGRDGRTGLATRAVAQPASLPAVVRVADMDVWREVRSGRLQVELPVAEDPDHLAVVVSDDGDELPATDVSVTWSRTSWFVVALLTAVAGLLVAVPALRVLRGRRVPRAMPSVVRDAALSAERTATTVVREVQRRAADRDQGGQPAPPSDATGPTRRRS